MGHSADLGAQVNRDPYENLVLADEKRTNVEKEGARIRISWRKAARLHRKSRQNLLRRYSAPILAKATTATRQLDAVLTGSTQERLGIGLLSANRAMLGGLGLLIVPLGLSVFEVGELQRTWPLALVFILSCVTLTILSWRSPKWARRSRYAAPLLDMPLWGALQIATAALGDDPILPAMLMLSMYAVVIVLSSLCMRIGPLLLTTGVAVAGAVLLGLIVPGLPAAMLIGGPFTFVVFPLVSKIVQHRFLQEDEHAPTRIDGADARGVFALAAADGTLVTPRQTSPGAWSPPSPGDLDDLLEGFEIQQLLGRGGMGAVYRGVQLSLNRSVAIKILPPELADEDPSFAERFRREGEAMANLSHPNIVSVHDFGETDAEHCYIVMEFVDGVDLHQLIRNGDLDVERSIGIVDQICAALEFAHGQGYVHRDLKPANVLVSQTGPVKLCDFGLAKIIQPPDRATRIESAPTLTQIGTIMGTPDYSAPEQLDGREVDHRADLYSLGVIVYEMLTGEIPRGVFVPPSERVGVDTRLDEVVHKAMNSEPGRRFQTASEVRTEVASILST